MIGAPMLKRAFLMCCWSVLFLAAASARAWNQAPPRDDTKGVELPDGEGQKILRRACTTCHDLQEVAKFRDYYTKDDWRDVVGTMVQYGAELKDGETEVLVNYLGEHFSKKAAK